MQRANFYFIIFVYFLAGCSVSSDSDEVIWLKDLKNPFIGVWESRIPSMDNAKMISEFKADGTFTCGFPEVSGYEGPFNGGYVVTGNIMVTYLDFDGVAGYIFNVVNNDTINVTEIDEVKKGGEKILGKTSSFIRVTGSLVNKEDKPIVLSHAYLGTWKCDSDVPISSDNNTFVRYLVIFEMGGDGMMTVDYDVAGGSKGKKTGCYFIYNDGKKDLLILFDKDTGFSAKPISFVSDNKITISYEGVLLPCSRIP